MHSFIPVLVEQSEAFAKVWCCIDWGRQFIVNRASDAQGMTQLLAMTCIDLFNSSMWGIFAYATFVLSLAQGIVDNPASRCIWQESRQNNMTGLLCVVHDIALARLGQCGLQQVLLAGGIDAFNSIPTG